MRRRIQPGTVLVTDSSDSYTSAPKRLLFVCTENSHLSQMAEAFARIYGRELVEVYSAGLRPAGQINPKTIEAMRAVGYDPSHFQSKSLAELPDIEFDFVVTMGRGDEFPFIRAKLRAHWNIPDPNDMLIEEFRTVRDMIETRVLVLLRTLRIRGHTRWA
jgi:arsenate reductase